MTIFDLLLLAVSLAMDCLAVSIACGSILGRWQHSPMLRIAFLFGFFQAFMPLPGWLVMRLFARQVEAYGHWIAALLLFYVGGRMIWGVFREADDGAARFNPVRLSTQLLLAVATSIDALAVGGGMAVTGCSVLSQLLLPLSVIGIVSFLFSLLGHGLGVRFGGIAAASLKPELLGGIILVLLGLKQLLFAA